MNKSINVYKVNGQTIVLNVNKIIHILFNKIKYHMIVVFILINHFVMHMMNLNKNVKYVKRDTLLIMIIYVN